MHFLTLTRRRLSAKFFRTSYLTFFVHTRLFLFSRNLSTLSLLDSGEYAPMNPACGRTMLSSPLLNEPIWGPDICNCPWSVTADTVISKPEEPRGRDTILYATKGGENGAATPGVGTMETPDGDASLTSPVIFPITFVGLLGSTTGGSTLGTTGLLVPLPLVLAVDVDPPAIAALASCR
jgi:hypothetical protein